MTVTPENRNLNLNSNNNNNGNINNNDNNNIYNGNNNDNNFIHDENNLTVVAGTDRGSLILWQIPIKSPDTENFDFSEVKSFSSASSLVNLSIV